MARRGNIFVGSLQCHWRLWHDCTNRIYLLFTPGGHHNRHNCLGIKQIWSFLTFSFTVKQFRHTVKNTISQQIQGYRLSGLCIWYDVCCIMHGYPQVRFLTRCWQIRRHIWQSSVKKIPDTCNMSWY